MSDIIETRLNFFLKSTEILTLESGIKGLKILCDLVGEDGFDCLTNLSLSELDDLEYLINTADGVPQSAFPVLEDLCLYNLDNLKGITSHECRLPNKAFSALKVLTLYWLRELTNLWKGPTQLVWLGNLTTVNVTGCDKLESVFSLSTARDLAQLQDLEINYCNVMEEIVSSEGGEHEIAAITTYKIKFPKLKKFSLAHLPSFTGICKAMNAIELPQLSSLSLCSMPKLKRLWPASNSESNCDPIIQPLFNDKDKLATIEELAIYGMENLTEIWPGELEAKLREMTVKRCHGLSNILFPSNSIKGMQNLEILEVKDCQSIGVAFDLEGLVWEGILDMALPSLKKVKLRRLQKLTHVWKDNSPGIQGFQNLRSLIVNDCDNLRNLFSYSLTKLLVKLQEIEVTECGMMESIIGNEPNADDAVITNVIMFPQLSSLKLSDLPNLSSFFFEACTFEGSLLKTIEVINCPKMKILPSVFQRKLDQQKADFSTSSQQHLLDGKFIFSDGFVGHFRKLTITDINGSIEMWHNQLEVDRLDEVRFMLVQFCGKLSNVISSNLIQRLESLKRLKVWWCDSLETIFDLQGEEGTSIIGLLSWELKLMYLPKLMHIWKNVPQQTHYFRMLRSLEVERCDNLRYIFTISMVKVLVYLNYVGIGNCEKIEKIVTREEEEEEEDVDYERGKILIVSVELENLPNLVCIGIPESQIHISKLRVDICPKYRGYDVEGE